MLQPRHRRVPTATLQSYAKVNIVRPVKHYRTEGIVLRRQDFGEADRVITLFTPGMGKLRALAKGTRRPKSRMAGHLELFTRASVLIAAGRNLDLITQAEATRTFPALRTDLWRAGYASYAIELVDRFSAERVENYSLFDLLERMLEHLNGDGSAYDWAARSFELHLLRLVGYAPQLYDCLRCGTSLQPETNRFSPPFGGVLCAACGSDQQSARPLSVNALKAMRLLAGERFGFFTRLRAPADAAAEVEGHLRAKISYLLERQPASTGFLDQLRAERYERARAPSVTAATA